LNLTATAFIRAGPLQLQLPARVVATIASTYFLLFGFSRMHANQIEEKIKKL